MSQSRQMTQFTSIEIKTLEVRSRPENTTDDNFTLQKLPANPLWTNCKGHLLNGRHSCNHLALEDMLLSMICISQVNKMRNNFII